MCLKQSWSQVTDRRQLSIAREALISLANEDYRGNEPGHRQVARSALERMREEALRRPEV